MNKYSVGIKGQGLNRPGELTECADTEKRIKERLELAQDNLDFVIAINDRDVVDYSHGMQALGRAYMRVVQCRADLKRFKNKGKKNANKW